MTTYWLKITLKSDTAFGRGDGIAGLIDAEVQHDENGLPFLSGKTLKGLMTATCAEIISALDSSKGGHSWGEVAHSLLGVPGHLATHVGNLHIGDALLPPDLRKAIAYERARANNR
ncbi:MAG: RAMP superfamily protein, partial [Chloroflexota bacterium]